MNYDQEKIGDVNVIRIKEKQLTSNEAPDAKTALLGLIIGDGTRFLVNLKDVQRIDSTGLGALLFGVRQAEQHDKDIRFCEISSRVQFLIRIAHLEEVINFYKTEREALKDFRREEGNG